MNYQKILFKFIRLLALVGLLTGPVWAADRGPGGIEGDGGIASAERRVALVIGNSHYRSDYLPNAQHDAEDIAKVLRLYDFTVIHKQDLNQEDMENAVTDFVQRLGQQGIGLFYYAGHGMQVEQRNYLVPIGAKISRAQQVKYRTVDAQWVVDEMNAAGSRVSIVILDACRNNPFRSYFRSSNGLAAMHAPRGTIISFATAPGKKASDGDKRNGLYTEHLLKAIQTPGLTIEQVLKQTATQVELTSDRKQVPWRSSSLTGKDFCFTTACQQPDETEKAALQQRLAELEQRLAQLSSAPAVQPQASSKTSAPDNVVSDSLKDGGGEPEMVVIPAGRFQMGDIQGGGDYDEKPVHWVSVKRFAMSRYEVTVGEFRRFVNATGYQTEAETGDGCLVQSRGWKKVKAANWRNPAFSQLDSHPVVCVSWHDAVAYINWLSQQTGHKYRLLTEAEWEYAARANTKTRYWWGNQIGSNKVNCRRCGDGFEQTAPVGSFEPNLFGLFDMLGNVWEWTCSEYEGNYAGKENQCADNKRVGYRMIRGGAWNNFPRGVRAAYRGSHLRDSRLNDVGFRVAR